MAEVGLIAAFLQIADIGFRLSFRLYTLGDTVASADKSVISISKDVSQTSTVLKELGQTLDRDRTSRICSPNAVQTADSIVKECQRIFQEMDQVLVKNFPIIRSEEKDRKIKAAQVLERLRWPFIKGKIELLTSNMERQKSTLVLMLNVIALARHEYERTALPTAIAEQRSLIQDLARSNEELKRRFEQLNLGYENVPVISAGSKNLMAIPKAHIAQGFNGALAAVEDSKREPSAGAQGSGPQTKNDVGNFDISDTSSRDKSTSLLQQYEILMGSLLGEVSAPVYKIAEESRSRIKFDIILTHRREMQLLEQVQHSEVPNAGMSMQMQQPGPGSSLPVTKRKLGRRLYLRTPIPSSEFFNSRESHLTHTRKRKAKSPSLSPESPGNLVSYPENEFPYPRLSKKPAPIASRGEYHEDIAAPTEGTSTLDSDAIGQVHPASSCQDVGTTIASKSIATCPTEEPSQDSHRKPSPERRFEGETTENWVGDVVDNLLAVWTILPLHASRTVSEHDSFAVVAH